jgi:hypothetical protein
MFFTKRSARCVSAIKIAPSIIRSGAFISFGKKTLFVNVCPLLLALF